MGKGKGRSTSLFLVFCMVLSMISAIPARAAEEGGEESQEEPCGLIVADWLETYSDEEGVERVLVDEETGYPVMADWEQATDGVPAVGDPMQYLKDKDISISDLGSALWIDYRNSEGVKTPVSVDDLTVEYIGEKNEESAVSVNKDDLIGNYPVPTSDGEGRDLVLFKPDQLGYYRFSYKQLDGDGNEDEKLIVHVDYPEIGIYSAQNRTIGNLYPANNELWEENFDYIGWKGKSDNKIYLNLYNRYDADSMELTEYTLYFWDEDEHVLTGNFNGETLVDGDSDTVDGKNITEYMSVSPAEGQTNGWYQITFTEDFSSKDNFRLDINGKRSYNNEDNEDESYDMGVILNGSFQPFGLVAADWLATDDQGKILLDEDGYPVDYENNSIPYTDNKEASTSGSALWIDYRDADGVRTPVLAENITAVDYSEKDPDDETSKWTEKENFGNLIEKYPVQTSNDQERNLVLFKPDKEGYYRFTYKDCKDDDAKLIVHVDFPEVGFYSAPNRTMENLYLADDYFWDGSVSDYTGLIEDNDEDKISIIYVNLYNKYSNIDSSADLSEGDCQLEIWDEDPPEDISAYMKVEKVSETQESGWYKITFKDAIFEKEGFNLKIIAPKSDNVEDGPEAYLSGSFQQSGLYVTWDDKYRCSGENVLHYPEGIYPDATKLKFGQVEKDENGKIKYSLPYELSKEDIKMIRAKRAKAKTDDPDPEWRDVTKDENDCIWDVKDGALEIMSYYQQDYEITIGEECVYVHPYMEVIEFFTNAVRPADPEPLDTRIRTTKVNEGTTGKVYVMPYIEDGVPFAVNIDKMEIKATVGDKQDVTKTYIDIEKDSPIKDDDGHAIGYAIEITDQAKEDFDIVVTAYTNGSSGEDPEQEYVEPEQLEGTLSVDINKRSSLQVTPPTKTVYTEGETFDPTGMTVELVYEDGTKETVQKGYTVTPAEPLKTTDTSVTVSYLGLTTTQKITVNPKQQPTTEQPTTEQPTTQTPPANQPSTEGTVLSSQETGEKAEFTVTSDDSVNPTVAYKKTTEKKEKSVKIPNTVKVNGITYKVTSIADNAFKGNKTVTKVTVGSNITSIGKNAFANCKKLKTVTVSKNVTTVGDNAFKGCAALTKITLPAKTKKIGKDAFSGCKKLKTLTIKSKNLTSKTVSKNAFKGITSKTTIKVPASKLAAYKKLFKKKGLAKNVKVTR